MKDGYHVNCTVSSNFLLDKGRVAENLQKECLCYFIIIQISYDKNQRQIILLHLTRATGKFLKIAQVKPGEVLSARFTSVFVAQL